MPASLDIAALVDRQRLGRLTVRILVLSFLAMMADGYDILALAYAAPAILREWGVGKAAFGAVISAGLFGILFGAPLFGWLGDRFGRKSAIVSGCVLYGAATLGIVAAPSLAVLAALRFVTGIGVGGLMPNTIALNAEFAPRRWRATLVIVMFTGITLGGSLPGWIAADLVPDYGWRALFVIGGVGPLAVAGLLALFLPESIKFLALEPRHRARVAALARRMDPAAEIGPETRFAVPQAPEETADLRAMFAGGLKFITPLLWLLFAANLMANYFLNSWMPTMFELGGMSAQNSAFALSLYQIGGTMGGLTVSMLLDRFGLVPVVALFVLACPAVALIGEPGLGPQALFAVVSAAGFAILGLQFGINAISGLIYPTVIRSKGSGWAFAIGRFGSVLGPIVGGVLLSMKIPTPLLFYAPAAALALGALGAILMLRLCIKRFGGLRLGDTPNG